MLTEIWEIMIDPCAAITWACTVPPSFQSAYSAYLSQKILSYLNNTTLLHPDNFTTCKYSFLKNNKNAPVPH